MALLRLRPDPAVRRSVANSSRWPRELTTGHSPWCYCRRSDTDFATKRCGGETTETPFGEALIRRPSTGRLRPAGSQAKPAPATWVPVVFVSEPTSREEAPDMARRSDRSRRRRRRVDRLRRSPGWPSSPVASSFAVAAFAAGGSSGDAHDSVVVCESGVVASGDVRTSSAVAVRVPDGASVTVAGGCRVTVSDRRTRRIPVPAFLGRAGASDSGWGAGQRRAGRCESTGRDVLRRAGPRLRRAESRGAESGARAQWSAASVEEHDADRCRRPSTPSPSGISARPLAAAVADSTLLACAPVRSRDVAPSLAPRARARGRGAACRRAAA